MTKLTKNETAVFNAIQTAITAEDIAVITDMKKAAVLGVLASLMKKGVAVAQADEAGKLFARTDVEVELYVEPVQEVQEVQQEPVQEVQAEVKQEVQQEPVQEVQEEVKEQKEEKVFDNHVTKSGKPKKVTNAMKIREQIAMVKANMTKEEAINHVIQFGVTVLGQSKALAKAYVTENYDKVKV